MRIACASHCICPAASIAIASLAVELPPFEPDLAISPCVIATLTVDGLPVVKHGYCRWENGRWWPLDLPSDIIISIEPKDE